MSDYEKAKQILCVLTRIYPSRKVVMMQPEEVIQKCSSEELNFYYRRLCKNV